MNIWTVSYEGFDPKQEKLREALCTLGNGYFCTRGAAAEASADEVHYPGTYLPGGYNRAKTEIAGKVIENEDLVNMPNWLCLSFRIEYGGWFNLRNVELLEYEQKLDLKQGVLIRDFRFQDGEDRITRVTSSRIVSMANPHLAAEKLTLHPENWSGRVQFRTALDGRLINDGVVRYRDLNSRHLRPIDTHHHAEDIICLRMQTNQSRLGIAEAARTEVYRNGDLLSSERTTMEETGYICQLLETEVNQKETVKVEKVASLFTSRDPAISEVAFEACKKVTRAGDYDTLFTEHAEAWKRLWHRFDMQFTDGDPKRGARITRILHLHTFHLLQTACLNTVTMDLDVGIPSRGWHGEAYRGHIFWDELFIFPFLNLRLPEITRKLLMYRYRRLEEARHAATQAGCSGAMFPWQSGSNGREETQTLHLNPRSGRWNPDNSNLQRHVNSGIAYNIHQYYQVTRDTEFISFYGAEMILEIARFWSSLASYNKETDRYEIRGVMGPDEYHDDYPGTKERGLNNNAYTNVMAVWVIERAMEFLDILPEDVADHLTVRLDLGKEEIGRWRDITRRMYVPFHGDGIISQFDGYETLEEFDWEGYKEKYKDIQRLDRILEAENDTPNRYKVSKQADVLMLFYLLSAEELSTIFKKLGYTFEYETIPNNIDYYLSRTSHGSTLSRVVHSWVLTRKQRGKSWELFNEALCSDVADIQGGTTPEGIHLGAMAGTVDQLQRGYTGVEVREDVLWFNPCLPEELSELRLEIRYRGYFLDVHITCDQLKVSALRAKEHPIHIGYQEEVKELYGRDSATFTL